MQPDPTMLEAIDLAARRGSLLLFARLRMRVERGRALLVTGRNGSGKTTLLRILAGLTLPEAGRVTWDGEAVAPHSSTMRAQCVFVGHAPALKDELTVEENLRSLSALAGEHAADDSIATALASVDLHDQRGLPARVLSQGQRRRVGLARLALLPRPVWLLDEPATALDSAGIALLKRLLSGHLERGGCALVATHQPLELPANHVRALSLS
jgi:heme exporter protein A